MRTQFCVLYRQFLFRMVDLDLLSARGDMGKLLGQAGALLGAVSLMLSGGALRFAFSRLPPAALLISAWEVEHFLIATTMMVVGLFAVLCWDSTVPDRRDVLVLAPLPIRTSALFLAKIAALAAALSLAVFAVNIFTGLTYPFVLGSLSSGIAAGVRSFAAYWIVMLAAGAFVICCVLTVQSLAAQLLPRRHFLRLSGFLQLAAFFLILSMYFLQPSLATPKTLAAPENQALLDWLPSYWFLGLFHQLNGSSHVALGALARRASIGLAIVGSAAAAGFLLTYFHTLRKIVDEPDILPGSRHASWSPRFGDPLQTAIVLFSARTLLRSRQHRLILSGYLGIGFAIALTYARSLLYSNKAHTWRQVNEPLLIASVVMMFFAVVGIRPVISLPLSLRANWIFVVTVARPAREYMAAIRRSVLALSVIPVLVVSAALFLFIRPLLQGTGHLVVLGLVGVILADLRLHGFQKIPFTCSYQPGKANIHVISGAYVIVLIALAEIGAQYELRALREPSSCGVMLVVLLIAAVWARNRTAALAASAESVLRFEELPPSDIFALDLHRDGMMLPPTAPEAKVTGEPGM